MRIGTSCSREEIVGSQFTEAYFLTHTTQHHGFMCPLGQVRPGKRLCSQLPIPPPLDPPRPNLKNRPVSNLFRLFTSSRLGMFRLFIAPDSDESGGGADCDCEDGVGYPNNLKREGQPVGQSVSQSVILAFCGRVVEGVRGTVGW